LSLATGIQECGFEAAVFDIDAYEGGQPEMADRVADYCPDLVGLPVLTTGYFLRSVRDFCQLVRKRLPNTRIVLGGPHATAWPEKTLEWFEDADYVLVGEADETLCELASQVSANVAEPAVPGLFRRHEREIVGTPPAEPPKDLDSIPIPDRKLLWGNFERGLYWRLDHEGPVETLLTSRGCPYSCKFCFKISKGIRMRSPEHVVQELVYLAELGISGIDICDDLFTANKRRCTTICNLILDAGLKLDIKVRSRVDRVDEELLALLLKAGVKAVTYGFESGSQAVLDAMNKRTTVEQNYEAVRMTKKAGLRCYADLFVGYPGETPETIAETEKFLLTARPTVINGGILSPLPRTKVYDEAKGNGTLVGDWSLDGPEPYVKLPWMEDCSSLWAHYKRMRNRFYKHPAILLSMALNAPSLFNAHHWRKGLAFIRTMIQK
jgi:radical SAM superfamily enzyme YgiQ (UPF0313 family)